MSIQNTIVEVINTLGQDLAITKFNKDFENLNAKEPSEIATIYPLNLIE